MITNMIQFYFILRSIKFQADKKKRLFYISTICKYKMYVFLYLVKKKKNNTKSIKPTF